MEKAVYIEIFRKDIQPVIQAVPLLAHIFVEIRERVAEFRQAIFACKTFEEVADILMPRPQTAGERIKKWFHPTRKELKFRIGFIVFLILYLLACYWIFGLESYNKVGCIIFY